MMKKKAIIGFLLIILGLVFLLKPHIELTGPVFLFGLGALFFIGYLLFQSYGLLIPGGILMGLGAGFFAKAQMAEETGKILFFILFGAGFLLIYIVDRFKRATPVWPLIPGGILAGVGAYMAADRAGWLPPNLGYYVRLLWPLLLVALGIYLIIKRK